MAATIALLRQLFSDPGLSDEDVIRRTAERYGVDPVEVANEVSYDGGPSGKNSERMRSSMSNYVGGLQGLGGEVAGRLGMPGVSDTLNQWSGDNEFRARVADQRAAAQGAVGQFFDDPNTGARGVHGLSDFGDYVVGLGIQSVPYIGEAVAGGMVGRGLMTGTRAAASAAREMGMRTAEEQAVKSLGRGSIAGAVAAGYPSAMADIVQNQKQQIEQAGGGQVDLLSAAAGAVPYALLNAFEPTQMAAAKLRGFRAPQMLDDMTGVRGVAARTGATIGVQGLKEGAAETGQELVNQYFGRMAVDPNATMTSGDAPSRYLESFMGGAALGGVAGGVGGGWRRSQGYVAPGAGEQAPPEQTGDPLQLGYSGPSGYITFPDGSTATGPDDELMHRFDLSEEQLANLRGGFDYMGAPGVRMDPDAAVPGTSPPGAQQAPTQTTEQRAIEDAAKEFERRAQAAHQSFTDMGPDGTTPTIRLKQPDVVLHHNLMELQAAGVITPEQFTSYAGAVKAGLRAGDKSAVNAVRKEVGRLTKEWEATKNAPPGVQVSDPRVQSALKGAPRRAQELGARLFQLVDDGKVPEDDIVDYVNDLVSRRPDYAGVETFIQEAGDVEPGSARTTGVAGGSAAAPGAVAAGSNGDLGRVAADGGGRDKAAAGAPVAGGATPVAVGNGKAGGGTTAVTPGAAEKFLAGFRGLPDRTRDVVKRWLGVDDNLEALDEPEALDSIGKTLTNEKTGAVGVSRQAVHKEIRAFLKSVGMPENLTPDMVRARFKIEVSDLADIGRYTDSARGTKATSVTAPDDQVAGNSDDAAFAGAADERDTRDEEGNVAKAEEDAAAEPDDDTEGGERPDDEVDRQRSFADTVEQLLEQDIKLGRVIPTDIAEAAEEWDTDAPSGVKAWAELEPVAQAAWVRNYAYTNGNPSAKTQESLNAQDDDAKQRAPKPDAADAEGPGRPAAVAPTQERNAAGDKRGGQQVQSPVAAAPAKPAAPVAPPAKPAVKVGTVTRVKKGDKPAKAKTKAAEPEVAPVLTPKEQWGALATATPGMPTWADLTTKQQDLATDLAHRDQFNLAAAQRIAGDTAVKSDDSGEGALVGADELQDLDHAQLFKLAGARAALSDLINLGISHIAGWVDIVAQAPGVDKNGSRVADGWIVGAKDSRGAPEVMLVLRDDMDAPERRFVLSHELGHVADMAPFGGVYSANSRIRPGGAVWNEIRGVYDADPEGGAWDAVLSYPFSESEGVDWQASELFAQLVAIYANPAGRAGLLRDAPVTHDFIEAAVNDIRTQKAPVRHYQQEVASRRAAFDRKVGAQGRQQPNAKGDGKDGRGRAGADGQKVVGVSKGYAGAAASQMSGVRRANFKVAVAMERKGKTAEAIRMATSWFRGLYDKQWRFEFDDSGARWKVNFAKDVPESKSFSTPTYVKLGDILEHKSLFKVYPKARDINVVKREGVFDFFKGLQGWSNANEIGITPYATDPMSTLLHEVQHWIQDQEGFARGGNENSVLEALTDKQREKAAKQVLDKLETSQESRAKKRSALVKLAPFADRVIEYKAAEAASSSTFKAWKDTDPTLTSLAEVMKESWKLHYDEAQRLKYELWKDAFGTADWFRISSEEQVAWINVAGLAGKDTVADITAKLDKEIVDTQQKIAALKSGDPEALKKAIKESGQAHGLYRAIAGEIEARDVQARQKMEGDERRKTTPFTSETFDPADVVVTKSEGAANASDAVERLGNPFPESAVQQPVYHATQDEFAAKDIDKGDIGIHFGTMYQAADRGGMADADYVFGRATVHGTPTHEVNSRMGELATGENIYARQAQAQAGRRRMLKFFIDLRNPVTMDEEPRGGQWHSPEAVMRAFERSGVTISPELKSAVDGFSQSANNLRSGRGMFEPQRKLLDRLVAEAKAGGYDGVVYRNEFEGRAYDRLFGRRGDKIANQNSFIVFDKAQVSEPVYDIRYSRGGSRAAAAVDRLAQQQSSAGRVSAAMPAPARNAFTDIRNAFKKISPWLLTNLQLAKEFGKEIPTLMRYVGLGDLMRQKRTSTQMEFNAVAVDWDKLPRTVKTQLHALMQAATMQEMHPDLPFEHKDNAHLKRKDPAEEAPLRAQHAALAAKYRQLKAQSPEAVGVYQRAKDLLDKSWKERAEAYKALVADTYGESMVAAADAGDAERLEKLRRQGEAAEKDYMAQLSKIKGPYFPLMRFGEYLAIGKSAEYTAAKDAVDTLEGDARKKAQGKLDELTKDPKHYVVSAHELRSAAEAAAARYSAQGLDATTQMGELRLDSVRPATKDTITHLTEAVAAKVGAKEGDAVRDALTEVFLRGLPEMHALRREAERKGVTGADTDMLRAFSAAGQSNAFYAARLVYAKDMADTLLNMKKEVKGNVDLQHVYREMQQRMALDMQFTQTPIQDFATSMSWVYHLGLSPSFVLMNATQPWLVSVPVLAGKFGVGKATSAMARASRDALAVLRDARWKDGKWDWWSGISEGSIPGPSRNEDRAAIRKLLQRGIVDEGIQHELSMFASDSSRWVSKVNRVMGWTTQQVEVANRLATALAAFRLARQNGMSEDAATEYAYDVTHTTQLDYSSDSTARFMRTGGGIPGAKLIFQFRRYQQGINYLLGLNIRKSFGDGPDAVQARATLGYLAVASGASAGVLGLPYMGVALFLANLAIPDDDEDGDAETQLRNLLVHMTGDKDTATALAKGLPTLWGWDLSKRIGLGDIASIFPMAKYDRAKTGRDTVSETLFSAAGPAAGTAAQILDGAQTFMAGDFVKGTEKMIPKAAADLIKAARYKADGMSTGTGETILDHDEISAWNAFTRGLGISSTKESNYYDGTRALQSVKTSVEDRKSQIASRFRAAVSRGEDLASVRESIVEFNEEHPQHRIQPKDEVQWRRDAQKARRQRDDSGIRVNPTRDGSYSNVMEFAR